MIQKRIVLVFIGFLISCTSHAQVNADTLMLVLSAVDTVNVFPSPDPAANVLFVLPPPAAFLASSFIQSDEDGDPFWKIVYRGRVGYVPDDHRLKYDRVDASYFFKTKLAGDSARAAFAKKVDKSVMDDLAKVKATRQKNGFAITNWAWSYENEYSSAATVEFTIENFSKKRIKYVTIFVSAKNAVEDKILSIGKASVPLKGIGPIEPGDTGSYSFDHAFWSTVIDTMAIDKVSVVFFDGTQKTLTTPKDYIED